MATVTRPGERGSSRTAASGSRSLTTTKKTMAPTCKHAIIGDTTLESRTLDGTTDKVLCLPPSEWQRICNTTTSSNVIESQLLAARSERQALHQTSQSMVKTWDNTLEGQRLKKLQRLKTKAEKEEEVSQKMDAEEAQWQAERRKEAIAKAREGIFYQTDRVKKFHESLVLSEVLREREAQVEFKHKKEAMRQGMDNQYVQRMREDHRQALIDDREKARVRIIAAEHSKELQRQQMKEKREMEMEERRQALKEQLECDRIAERYHAEERAFEDKVALEKVKMRKALDRTLEDKKAAVEQKKAEDNAETAEIGIYAKKKQQMAVKRKQKEHGLQKQFRDKQDAICAKLHAASVKARDNEEQEIAEAQAEAFAKRDREVKAKQDRFIERQRDINQHRDKVMEAHEEQRKLEAARQADIGRQRKELDKQHFAEQQKEMARKHRIRLNVQDEVIQQVHDRLDKEEAELKEQLEHDRQCLERQQEEEKEFRRYTSQVISEVKKRSAPAFVVERAANVIACGGHGPELLERGGVKPSYMAMDTFGTELKSFGESRLLPPVQGSSTTAKGRPSRNRRIAQLEADTKKRSGFVW